ncbi:helix-turn-helix transcriptional regulator [Eupransor demetentiae]|uniref:HTH cro/C1-type domain-containing protein n=1 Tax=Eupransor demetentiae TaxID=3109584 RepID=A0ABM9N4W4_9LACO|nr:hypothetical protein R54876_GBNLAHCA_00720 [Lactobacillaceae bacterium LMG 33000]
MTVALKFKNIEDVEKMIALSGDNMAEFSKRVGVHKGTMDRYINGRSNPSPKTAKKISKTLGKPMADIFLAESLPNGQQKRGGLNGPRCEDDMNKINKQK